MTKGRKHGFPTEDRKRGASEKDKKDDEGFILRQNHTEKNLQACTFNSNDDQKLVFPSFRKENPSSSIIDISHSF